MEPLNHRERHPFADRMASSSRQPLIDIDDVHTVAQGIVDAIHDPLLVLDQNLRVITANRAFCQTFSVTRQSVEDRPVCALGDGQWNIPALRLLLENIALQHGVMEGYEVEREFPEIGRRTMLLNAREVVSRGNARKLILLTIEDVTERRATEGEMTETSTTEGNAVARNAASCCKQPTDHREHPPPQSSNGAVGGDAEPP
jgi:PAS domain S-box-containing protein